jgi:hypothetical protein
LLPPSSGINLPGQEADYSPPSVAEVKNVWSYTSTSHMSSWQGVNLASGMLLPLPMKTWFDNSTRQLTSDLAIIRASVISEGNMYRDWSLIYIYKAWTKYKALKGSMLNIIPVQIHIRM